MSRYISKIELDTQERYPCSLCFTEKNKLTRRTAHPLNGKTFIEIKLPRTLGATQLYAAFFSEDVKTELAITEFIWYNIETELDVYRAKVPKEKLGVGLYYIDICVKSFSNRFCLRRVGGDFLLTKSSYEGSLVQLSIYDFKYEQPSEILGGIIYHIFVDRFNRNGRSGKKEAAIILDGPWDSIPEFPEYAGAPVKNNIFYGGTLDGIKSRLSYIKSLGVNIIYLSPIFESVSNHRYDTADYMKVDSILGGEEALVDLIEAAEKKNIKIILDGVFNHTGDDSVYFNKYKRYGLGGAYNSKESPYFGWYEFKNYPREYLCWWDICILPKIHPDREGCRDFFVGEGGVIDKYRSLGIYGFRLDVCDELSDGFISEIKKRLSRYGSSYLLGEVWEDGSNKIAYGKRKRYFLGEELDGVMNYPLRRGIIDFLTGKETESLKYALTEIYENAPKRISDTQMNILGSHDTVRILTELSGESGEGLSNSELSEIRLDKEKREIAKKRLYMAYTILATLPGIPSVFYGDEVGLEGYKDPFNRMPYPYGKEDREILSHYRRLGKIRRENPVYRDGEFELIYLSEELLIFSRYKNTANFITVVNNSDKTLEISTNNPLRALIDEGICQKISPFTAEIFKARKKHNNKSK